MNVSLYSLQKEKKRNNRIVHCRYNRCNRIIQRKTEQKVCPDSPRHFTSMTQWSMSSDDASQEGADPRRFSRWLCLWFQNSFEQRRTSAEIHSCRSEQVSLSGLRNFSQLSNVLSAMSISYAGNVRPHAMLPSRALSGCQNCNVAAITCRASLDIALRSVQSRLVGFCDSDEKP